MWKLWKDEKVVVEGLAFHDFTAPDQGVRPLWKLWKGSLLIDKKKKYSETVGNCMAGVKGGLSD